jgi:PPOX class probable F420-dependent enzyme
MRYTGMGRLTNASQGLSGACSTHELTQRWDDLDGVRLMSTSTDTGSGVSQGGPVGLLAPPAAPSDRMRDLIAGQQVLMLATRQGDGSAHVVPVMYLFEDGRFMVATSSQSRKARNVAAGPRVTVTIEDREATAWVSATGYARLLSGRESRQINHRVDQLWMTEQGFKAIGGLVAEAEDVTVVITPQHWRSWDFHSGFLAELEAAGVDLDDAAPWFH